MYQTKNSSTQHPHETAPTNRKLHRKTESCLGCVGPATPRRLHNQSCNPSAKSILRFGWCFVSVSFATTAWILQYGAWRALSLRQQFPCAASFCPDAHRWSSVVRPVRSHSASSVCRRLWSVHGSCARLASTVQRRRILPDCSRLWIVHCCTGECMGE